MRKQKYIRVRFGAKNSGDIFFSYRKDDRGGINNTTHRLFYSKLDADWASTVAGKSAVIIHDDGNGLTVTIPARGTSPMVKFRLNYGQAQYLRILLALESEGQEGIDVFNSAKRARKGRRGPKR